MTILLLAGSGEAKSIAWALKARGIDVIASLAGATRAPLSLPVTTRIGGFGGEDGFRTYLEGAGITAVLDATHPFADQITKRTARVCAELGMPYLYCCRPGWTAEKGDLWTYIADEAEAASHIPIGANVFLGTGRQTLHRFANLEGRRVICRQIDPPTEPFPFEGGEFLIGRPPFPVEQEKELFKRLLIDWIVVKDAGGAPSRTKLTAAGDVGIPVLMIKRPDPPDAPIVETVDEAVAWAAAL